MYDRETTALIGAAPSLSGLDPEALPRLLTSAYAELVTLRLRLAEGRLPLTEAVSQLDNINRLANSYEVITATATVQEERRAAAFVAASAHHLVHRLSRLRPQRTLEPHLQAGEISAVIAGVLLYLTAGYQSDASELARELPSNPESTDPAATLVQNIRRLARAEFTTIARSAAPVARVGLNLHDQAIDSLWTRINRGVMQLARELLTADRTVPEMAALNVFESARKAAVSTLPDVTSAFESVISVFSTYAGPHHLAKLLSMAAGELGESALVRVRPPAGTPENDWVDFLRELALSRPLLWKNHNQAIASGYLDAGRSAVISFPTGAGKSTLSELKIASTLLGGGKTIFLAPTRALVWQVARDLERTFANQVRDTLADDGAYDESLLIGGGMITVMTPERCLTLLSSSADLFAEVRLLVFDECHLLHGSQTKSSRRSLDAMLSLLGVLELAPAADVLLLSAMVANGASLAAWLEELTMRPCVTLDVGWKPTRQVRGCLVYPEDEISALLGRVKNARRKRETKYPSAALRRSATLTPLGLFSLQQQWHSQPTATTYSLPKLKDEPVSVAIGNRWNITANKNEVAATLASDLARVGVKTIVLLQDKDACTSVAAMIGKMIANGQRSTALLPDEQQLVNAAADDLGGEDLVLGPLYGGMSVHHGLLLLPERRLNESVFSRADGVPVIAATPTLAQGMNLPAEAVLIVGDMRFDAAAGERVGMAAHELLNAAGRAGRAGHFASGFVLVIPDTPIAVSPDLRVSPSWRELQQRVFAHQDQCLIIEDPVQLLLDRIQNADALQDPHVRYFLTRLPVHEADGNADDSTRRLLQRSLAAFFARRAGSASSFSLRVDAALTARRTLIGLPSTVQRLDRIGTTLGWPLRRVRQIDSVLREHLIGQDATVGEVVAWLFRLLRANQMIPADLMDLLRARFAFDLPLQDHMEPRSAVSPSVLGSPQRRLQAWMAGNTFWEIELDFDPNARRGDHAKNARRFVTNALADFAFVAGGVAQIRRNQIESDPRGESEIPAALAAATGCIREGLDSPEKLVLRRRLPTFASRRSIHRAFADLAPHLPQRPSGETLADCGLRVDLAYDAWRSAQT